MMHEKIDALRELLELPDRRVASIVELKGLIETTADGLQRTFAESGDVAYVFIGPTEMLHGVRRENTETGAITYEFTVGEC